MDKRAEALAKFEGWERELIDDEFCNAPKFIKDLVLKIRMKKVVKQLDNGKLDRFM